MEKKLKTLTAHRKAYVERERYTHRCEKGSVRSEKTNKKKTIIKTKKYTSKRTTLSVIIFNNIDRISGGGGGAIQIKNKYTYQSLSTVRIFF